MINDKLKILFLEDTNSDIELMQYELKKAKLNYQAEIVETETDFIFALEKFSPDVILSDYSLPSFDGMKAFRLFKEKKLLIPFILVTSNMSEQLALDCLNEGIDDFILKSSFGRIPKAIKRAIEKKNIEKEKERISIELVESQIQLRKLVNEIQITREVERAHIAREIHDELGQELTALKMDVGWIIHKQNDDNEAVLEKLNGMLKLCDGIINTVRRLSSELRPAIIDDLGLIAAMEWKCTDFEGKTNIPCEFISSVKERKFENSFSINSYRVLQESLTNVIRHAKAKSVVVKVSENEKDLCIEIVDDGVGMNEETANNRKTLGMLGMKERASLLGGSLNVVSKIDKGTHIILTLPFENEDISS